MSKSLSKIVVLISGSGSNLQAIIDNSNNIGVEISCVISNKKDAFGLKRAQNAGINTKIIKHQNFESRLDFDKKLIEEIDKFNPKIIVLAGFMRILSDEFINYFAGRIINIHPSLLPKFKGLNTHKRAIEMGEKYAGASVHFVTSELDSGEIIIQKKVKINANDSIENLAKKVLKQEHIIYPKAIKQVLSKL